MRDDDPLKDIITPCVVLVLGLIIMLVIGFVKHA